MNLLRSLLTVGGLTMISRVLGFARDILIAGALGTGPIADAFVVAFRFPNLFRRFFAEGAFNAAFIPLYAKQLEGEGKESARAFSSEAMSGLVFILLIITLLSLIFMPWLMLIMAGGFLLPEAEQNGIALSQAIQHLARGETTEKFDLAVQLTRIAFPYLLFMSLVALLSGILNSVRRFAMSAAAPVILNLVLIGVLLFALPYFPSPGHALVWGVTAAGVLQFLALAWGVHRAGLMPRLVRPRWNPAIKRLVTLGIPGVVAGGITHINLLIGSMIASFEHGAPAKLFYADRVYQLPLGLIGVAMGVVLLPEISRRLRAGDETGAHWTQNRAIEISMLLTLPAALALMTIPDEIIRTLFGRGAFGDEAIADTAKALFWFSLGLPAFVLIRVMQAQFFAREDTKTPMWFAGINTLINVSASLVLFNLMGFVGIAIATSAAAWVNTLLLTLRLIQLKQLKPDPRLMGKLPRIGLAGLAMATGLTLATPHLTPWLEAGEATRFGALLGLVFAGMVVYFGLILALRAASLSDLRGSFKRG